MMIVMIVTTNLVTLTTLITLYYDGVDDSHDCSSNPNNPLIAHFFK